MTLTEAHTRSILDVALALGADPRISRASEIGVPCPGCGGTDRFTVNHTKNVFLCRHSGAGGDPIDLVRHVHNVGVRQAAEWLTGAPMPERKPAPVESGEYRQKARERGYKIWLAGYKPGKVIEGYFTLRGIPIPQWKLRTLREADRLPYWAKVGDRWDVIHEGPAMLAAITGDDGKFIGVHRTWLGKNGKAEIFHPETGEQMPAKKVEGSLRGGRIVLRDGPGSVAVGEGIESVLSWDALDIGWAGALWSGISLGNIAGKAAGTVYHPTLMSGNRRAKVGNDEPADCVCLSSMGKRVTLLADSDSDPFTTGLDMARACKRLGTDDVRWPHEGMDWNDVLRARE